jgi:apolipoprotein N-acyltransferase
VAGARDLGRRRLGLLAGYVAATFLSFPVGGAGFDVGWLFAWLGPAFLWMGIRGLAPRRAAGVAFAAALIAHAAVLHWIYVVTVTYGHAPRIAGVAAPLGLAAYMAAHTALFAALAARLGARGAGGPLALAAVWTATDHLRSFSLSGFPWATLGYAQHANPAFLALAPWTGVYGLSFVTVLGGVAAAQWLVEGRSRSAGSGLAALLALLALGGVLGLRGVPPDGAAMLRVAVLQGNIDQGVKWSPDWAEHTLGIYEELTRASAAQGAAWIVWPETAVPGSVTTDPELRARLGALARDTGATLVVGGVGVERDGEALRFFDSAFVFTPAGELEARYDKAHLVPYGEYVPLRGLLGRFLSAVARGIANTDVSRGAGPRALALQAPGGPVPAGVPICYELLFPDLMRRFVGDGAQLLLAITNDAWYGRTGAPHQFLAITALRAAENRVWIARAANTGISAFIDPQGRVQEQTRIFERGFLVRDVPLRPPPSGGSFYTRRGDVFAWSCWIGALVAVFAPRRDPEGTRRS